MILNISGSIAINISGSLVIGVDSGGGGGAPTEFGVWTGPTRPPDIVLDESGTFITDLDGELAAVGFVINPSAIEQVYFYNTLAPAGSEAPFNDGVGWNLDRAGVENDLVVQGILLEDTLEPVPSELTVERISVAFIRHSAGLRLLIKTATGSYSYNNPNVPPTGVFYAYMQTPILATEWWTGPLEADPISGTAQIEAWLIAQHN